MEQESWEHRRKWTDPVSTRVCFCPDPSPNLNVIEDLASAWNANRSKAGKRLVCISHDSAKKNHGSVPNGNADGSARIDRVLVE